MGTYASQSPDTRFTLILSDITRLEHESRKYLYLGFIVGVVLHALGGLLIPYNGVTPTTTVRQTVSIPAEIIELAPRSYNPYDNWRHSIAPRRYQRHSSSIPSVPEITTSQPQQLESFQDQYSTGNNATAVIEEQVTGVFEDSLFAYEYQFRGPDYDIPLKNQLFIDTGDLKTEIIFNPQDKRAIQGYVHFGIAWGKTVQPPDSLRQSIKYLAQALLTHTNIVATADRQVFLAPILPNIAKAAFRTARSEPERSALLDDYASRGPKLNEYPFLFMATDGQITLREEERGRLRNYLLGQSGFILIDNGAADYDDGHIDALLRTSIASMLCTKEVKFYLWLMPLPAYDPLFHAFFDFNDTPPSTANPSASFTKSIYGIYTDPMKLVGIYTPQGYSRSWHDSKNTEQLKMGVNMVVYALTRYKEALAADGKTSELLSEQRILRK